MTPIAEWEEMTQRKMEETERDANITASCKIRMLVPELLKR